MHITFSPNLPYKNIQGGRKTQFEEWTFLYLAGIAIPINEHIPGSTSISKYPKRHAQIQSAPIS
jgi:hypothetical protein